MNSINQITEKNTKQKNFWSRFAYPVALISLLSLGNINDMQAQSNEMNNRIDIELSAWELIPQLDKILWVTLPAEYDSKVRNFVQNNYVMSSNNARIFTQNFIIDEMKKDRWISKQNQLLFIWYSIYLNIEWKDLYDGEDWDEKRLDAFDVSLDYIEDCGKRYVDNLDIYIKQRIKEINERTEEIRQRTEETRQRTEETRKHTEEIIRHTMSLDTVWLVEITRFYNLYTKNPSSVTVWEFEQAKKNAAHIISDCKRYWIDYKQLLSPEVCRFYGIE